MDKNTHKSLIKRTKGTVLEPNWNHSGKAISLRTQIGDIIIVCQDIDTIKDCSSVLMNIGFEVNESMIKDVSLFDSRYVTTTDSEGK